ncbi:MAG: alpha/beta hydrolase [Gemmataceae bacterium]
MSDWMYWLLAFVFGPLPIVGGVVLASYLYYRWRHLDKIIRIFEEKPLFIIPRGLPVPGAEEIRLPLIDGRQLHGCYLHTTAPIRRGVILFGLEFGSNRWACVPYTEKLRAAGYDVFACETRNQGDSDKDPTYEPLQWVTDRDLADFRAAVRYLLRRTDAHPDGIGVFGISKGGSLALLVAAEEPRIRAVATDGAFATYTTVVPFMRRFVAIYFKNRQRIRAMIPDWFYGLLGSAAIRQVEKKRDVKFVSVERAIRKLRQALFMIHGGGDNYITPEMAQSLCGDAKKAAPKELWIIPKAKHNQAILIAGIEYHDRVVSFFDVHLAGIALTAAEIAIDDTASAAVVAAAVRPAVNS